MPVPIVMANQEGVKFRIMWRQPREFWLFGQGGLRCCCCCGGGGGGGGAIVCLGKRGVCCRGLLF